LASRKAKIVMNFLDLKNVQERPTNKSKEAEWQKAQIKMALSKKP
jgi:hypothetical protein